MKKISTSRAVMIAGTLALAASACASGPEPVVERYYERLAAGDVEGAADLLSEELRTMGAAFGADPDEELAREANRIERAGGLARVRTEDLTGDDTRRTVRAAVELSDGSETVVDWTVTREADEWRLVGAEQVTGPGDPDLLEETAEPPVPAPIVEETPARESPLEEPVEEEESRTPGG